jgi:hypothetical protein
MAAPQMYDRKWMIDQFRLILTGWHQALRETSDSCAVWETKHGIHTQNFVSVSGKQCDGVTRMLPALAAWVCQPENPETITLNDGTTVRPFELLRNGLVNGTDPNHPDFWQFAPTTHSNQRQVESSIVAWSIWLARERLLPTLTKQQIANLQNWLASCTVSTDLFNNWTLFFATNHAARIALAKYGFEGDIDAVRKNLIVGEEADAGDGWLYDIRWSGIDYYNFWVNGSHHLYIRAMLPQYKNPVLDRVLERTQQRLNDVPYLIDLLGNNVLFGRSLAYRFGWLNGLMVAVFNGMSPVSPGIAREMVGRNLARWLEMGALSEEGAFRERLSPHGSDGGRDRYINCGHPYWCMQSFLCLALPASHAFWSESAERLPVESRDFLVARQGPGLVFQGIQKTGEVRLFNVRNLNHNGHTLYEKFVYASAFPCDAGIAKGAGEDVERDRRTCWDNQLGLRLADGSHVGPTEVPFVDVGDGRRMEVVLRFKVAADFSALVRTVIEIDADAYTTRHLVKVTGPVPTGAQWVEGGFALPVNAALEHSTDGLRGTAASGDKAIETERLEGWDRLHDVTQWRDVCSQVDFSQPYNIVEKQAEHFLLTAPVIEGQTVLKARHRGTIR